MCIDFRLQMLFRSLNIFNYLIGISITKISKSFARTNQFAKLKKSKDDNEYKQNTG